MKSGTFTQMTVKFPMNRDRFCQAVDFIASRDRNRYRTQADYMTAAILAFEDQESERKDLLDRIYQKIQEIEKKVDDLAAR